MSPIWRDKPKSRLKKVLGMSWSYTTAVSGTGVTPAETRSGPMPSGAPNAKNAVNNLLTTKMRLSFSHKCFCAFFGISCVVQQPKQFFF